MKKYFKLMLLLARFVAMTNACGSTKPVIAKAPVVPEMPKNDEMAMKQYMNTISPSEISERLHVFASQDFEGRRTGSRGQKRAAEYLSNFYHALGLEGPIKDKANPFLQAIEFDEVKTNGGAMMLGDQSFELDKDFAAISGIATDITSDVVFIGYGIQTEGYDDFEGLDVEGKTVVMMFGEPTNSDGQRLFDFSQQESFGEKMFTKLGIANMILTTDKQEMYDAQLPFLKGSRARISIKSGTSEAPAFSTFFMSPKKAAEMFGQTSDQFFKKIQDKLDAQKPSGGLFSAEGLKVQLEKADRSTVSHNVMAFLEGTDLKDEILVISSHYDHDGIKNGVIYPGADDDGSGTMGVMEVAEAFALAAKNGNRPRRSILFLNVTGEEEGLLGSEYYTDVDPIYPIENTIANLNIDMIGRVDEKHAQDSNYVYIIGSDMLSSELHAVHEKISKKHFPDMSMDFEFNGKDHPSRFYYRSDHYNFAKNNIPVIFYFNGTHEDYHQPTDTPDKINYGMLAQRAKLIFATAWELSNMESRPKVDVVLRP